jgi:very-short-patch-repair endonuclease
MIIRPKKKYKFKSKYKSDSIYDDLKIVKPKKVGKNNYILPKDKDSQAYKDMKSAIDFKDKIKLIKAKKRALLAPIKKIKEKRKASLGEIRIAEYLRSISIDFIIEKTFKDLINPETQQKLYMDFFLPNHNICIEFDGKQHYEMSKVFHKDNEQFLAQQRKDQVKNKFCLNRGFDMIRIKYNEYSKIDIIISTWLNK